MDYVQNLINLICGNDGNGGHNDGWVDSFIWKTMREEYDVQNGNPPSGKTRGTGRFGKLQDFGPMDVSNGSGAGLNGTNDPLYYSNMIDRLNTPFDHIDRILLQDFAGKNAMDIDGEDNYFKSLFHFDFLDDEYGITGFEVSDPHYGSYSSTMYHPVNSVFSTNANNGNGGFFLDSFTYTPFIDYSTSDPRIGVYSDKFLTDYNLGKYDRGYGGTDGIPQVDVNRRTMTSILFRLRNLDKDLYDAKVGFRAAIQNTDSKTYIYTFCEHLATLFAKLSNIRMSHEIYGFKHPHSEWEGILALDIWYQMLYREIDAQYPFNEEYFDMNPMVRKPIVVVKSTNGQWSITDKQGRTANYDKYIEFDNGKKWHIRPNSTQFFDDANNVVQGVELIYDETVDPGAEQQYAFAWDSSIWNEYNSRAKLIRDTRSECVTPRGVLGKIFQLVNQVVPEGEILQMDGNDFPWFHQRGKVYSDSDKSSYSRYSNLHLGRAYDEMSAKDYHDLMGLSDADLDVYDGKSSYVKPVYDRDSVVDGKTMAETVGASMIQMGCKTLQDAFLVIKAEKLFNICKSSGGIEEFNAQHAKDYSQAQCAIVIERVFSRLYKYLQFKSTTTEVFQRHINIDSGYKYLTTETILGSDNPASKAYYSESDAIGYLRYLAKLDTYLENGGSNILTPEEKKVLGCFTEIIRHKPEQWLGDKWDLCPLCKSARSRELLKTRAGDSDSGDSDSETDTYRRVVIEFNRKSWMQWSSDGVQNGDLDGFQIERESGNIPKKLIRETTMADSEFQVNLSKISSSVVKTPKFTDSGTTVECQLLGFSESPSAEVPTYGLNETLTTSAFPSGSVSLTLYAVWKTPVIVKFSHGDIQTTGTMDNIVVENNRSFRLPACQYVPTEKYRKAVYHESTDGTWVIDDISTLNNSQEWANAYGFVSWTYGIGNISGSVGNQGNLTLHFDPSYKPVVTMVATWREMWKHLAFLVNGNMYCEALVDARTLKVPQVLDPQMARENDSFLGWDRVPGSSIQPETYQIPIVCEEASGGNAGGYELVCLDENGEVDVPIVCEGDDLSDYVFVVNANIASVVLKKYGIVFKFLDDQGNPTFVQQEVQQNQTIPKFHIHSQIVKENGNRLVFRYWKLESGDISSSMTLLSTCVLVAVYDEIEPMAEEQEPVEEPLPEPEREARYLDTQLPEPECPFLSVDNLSEIPQISEKVRKYCKWQGLKPTDGDMVNFRNVDCPYVQLLFACFNRSLGEASDFNRLRLIEIMDVVNLIKALFKINIDIAHREYYLKIDVPEVSNWWYGYKDGSRWISFEPTVEFKFSNFHCENQIENDRLMCTVKGDNAEPYPDNMWVIPVNRELLTDAGEGGIHYNEFWYYYDYEKTLAGMWGVKSGEPDSLEAKALDSIGDEQKYYAIKQLYIYVDTDIQSPVDVNKFVRHKYGDAGKGYPIARRANQIRTFMSIVKKYRPVIMPNVRDIFNDCVNDKTKYEVDRDNDYGVFGWCTIPSKTMVNMEYNEESIIVPSSYDHHNRIGGNNFLQMDSDFCIDVRGNIRTVYEKWTDSKELGTVIDNVKNTWYYLYAQRDWTYFMLPFFNVRRNSELYSYMQDTYRENMRPSSSDHINGIIFERSNEGRADDAEFGDIVRTCQFLARRHHNENNLKILAERYTNLISYQKLKELTSSEGDQFNSTYGSVYSGIPKEFSFPFQDWVDDYDKTSSYVDQEKYQYNLGQAHAIDDFDEDSVWFYITMTEPVENLEPVMEIEDIMPFVFWWENRGKENNGPTAYCYGKESSAKLNYEKGGWCYSGAQERYTDKYEVTQTETKVSPVLDDEERWHAVQHTIGVDFSKEEYGGTILTTDNSGNVYKGAFDPNCSATDEKWKIHHLSNAFGTNQMEDPYEDKYYHGEKAHGNGTFKNAVLGSDQTILGSLQERPMTWNLWNCVRHYVYIKYFKNRNRQLKNNQSGIQELEKRTRKYVKSIYRTFQEKKNNSSTNKRTIFGDQLGGYSSTNAGGFCQMKWTNSFIEVSSILEVNARDHQASFVLFTGDVPGPVSYSDVNVQIQQLTSKYPQAVMRTIPSATQRQMAVGQYKYSQILNSKDNFRITTTDGIDGLDNEDGMRPRTLSGSNWVSEDGQNGVRIYQGYKYNDMPTTYVIGDDDVYSQRLSDVEIKFDGLLDLDMEFPESEYYLNDVTRKWVKRIGRTLMNRQIIPVYTSMETMTTPVHDLTDTEMKEITFQVVPQFYWKYEWAFNEYMIHRVGKLKSPSDDIVMYDMLGNVWEWVRDDWNDSVYGLNGKVNPIVGTSSDDATVNKVIRGGAFDQYIRKTISSSREELGRTSCKSQFGTKANVGFRPSLTYVVDGMPTDFQFNHETPVDLFFLFDASSSQDDQVREMVKSANSIVRMFAGIGSENRNVCHVGSALFMGPKIRLMCCEQHATRKAYHLVKTPRPGIDGTTGLVHDAPSPGDRKTERERWTARFNEWNAQPDVFWVNDEKGFPTELSAYFKRQFLSEKANYGVATALTERGMNLVDVPQEEQSSEMRSAKLMARAGDVGSGSTGSGSANYNSASNPYVSYELSINHMYIHKGVPCYLSDNPEVVPETVINYTHSDGTEFPKCHLMTYDPTPEAADYFEVPFVQSNKGVLMNWWGGSESVSSVLSNLLGDGFFHGWPWTPAIGYMFRNREIPKLVFVYTNEYDNNIVRTNTSNPMNLMVIPGVVDQNNVKFYPVMVKARGSDGAWIEQTKTKPGYTSPPDPYCLMYNQYGAMQDFLNKIELSNLYQSEYCTYALAIPPMSHEDAQSNFRMVPVPKPKKETDARGMINVNPNKRPVKLKSLKTADDLEKRSSGRLPSQITGWADGQQMDTVLTQEQVQGIREQMGIPGVSYNNGDIKAGVSIITDPAQAMTYGFYELNYVTSKLTDPMHLFCMVSDANAPKPLYDGYDQNDDAEDWKYFLDEDIELFNEIRYMKVPGTQTNWGQAVAANAKFLKGLGGSPDPGQSTNAPRVQKILGFRNPYQSIKIVWGLRKNGSVVDFTCPNTASYQYVVGLPLDGQKAKNKKNIWNVIKSWTFADWQDNAWSLNEWMTNYDNCRMKLTEKNANLYLVNVLKKKWDDGLINSEEKFTAFQAIGNSVIQKVTAMIITKLVSSESIRDDHTRWNTFSYGDLRNRYAFSNKIVIEDATTISYSGGGVLKIISFINPEITKNSESSFFKDCIMQWDDYSDRHMKEVTDYTYFYRRTNSWGNVFTSTVFAKSGNVELKFNNFWKNQLWPVLIDTGGTTYPDVWKKMVRVCAGKVKTEARNENLDEWTEQKKDVIRWLPVDDGNLALWGNLKSGVAAFYDNLHHALPYLLAYRYQSTIFDRLKNGLGKSVTTYANDDSDNVVTFKAIPIMDFSKCKDIFNESFVNTTSMLFDSSTRFSYSHCVVDLNPTPSDYGDSTHRPQAGKFPVEFKNQIEVNEDDTYKKSKMVLTRIPQISAESHVSTMMGSQNDYYGKVMDPTRIKYSDDEVILTQSRNDKADVVLGNGGAYQKKHAELGAKDFHPDDDLYNLPAEPGSKKKKYKMNRHFFLDPFELTIAQWCYVHGWNGTSSARTNLGDKLREIETSYWEYLRVWEKDEWTNLMTHGITRTGVTIASPSVFSGKTPEECIQWLVDNGKYDPLDDTRPYYYATYNDVRGTGQVYKAVEPNTDLAKSYVINPSKGDEYQMNSHTGASFMDILNSKAVIQNRKREYVFDSDDGGERLNMDAMNAQTDADKDDKTWRSGKIAGLNFDLPTEAQWEYCCRAGSESAFPMDNYLEQNFEENDPTLDLIAWYKYKLIGAKPEPERFCTWRISKMLFGMSKDKEMVNNVYEYKA